MIFDRRDFLVTKVVLLAAAVGTPLLSLGVPLMQWARGRSLAWEVPAPRGAFEPGAALRDGAVLGRPETVPVRIEHAGGVSWLASLLPSVVVSVAVVLVAWLLFRLVQRIERAVPFASSSATALRVVGAAVLVASVLGSLANGLADAIIGDRALAASDGPSITFELPFLPILAALVVLAVAEAFAQGARLQHEVEGLV